MLLQEKCGVVGVFAGEKTNLSPIAFSAALGVQHRGQNGAGMVIFGEKGMIKETGDGLLNDICIRNPDFIKNMSIPAKMVLVHTRYGTNGSWDIDNLQPCTASKKGQEIAVIHNGEFVNLEKPNDEISDTPIFTEMLAKSQGENWDERIINTLSLMKGSYSLIIGVDNKLYFARDPFGIKPLVIGKTIDRNWVITSETHALDKAGAVIERWVKPGEIGRISEEGLKIIKESSSKRETFCDFEWAYFCRPDSLLQTEGKNEQSVLEFRYRCGQIVAQENPMTADLVIGVPDSGVPFATGFAAEAKIPYRQIIIRDHFDINGNKRLFMGDSEISGISQKVLGKLSLDPYEKNWKDKKIIIGDDSLVRGNVSREITRAVRSMGAKEVHWVIGFPQIRNTCHLGVSMRTREELIAFNQLGDNKKIANEIEADSVTYISNKSFLRAKLESGDIVLPDNMDEIFLRNGGCGGCITGNYPIDKNGTIHPCLK